MSIGDTETRELKCLLNAKELLERATQFAHIDERIESEEECIKTLSQRSKALQKELHATKVLLRKAVANRYEFREVECRWSPDWDRKEMALVRQDTGELVEKRTMKPDELQMAFTETLPEAKAVEQATA